MCEVVSRRGNKTPITHLALSPRGERKPGGGGMKVFPTSTRVLSWGEGEREREREKRSLKLHSNSYSVFICFFCLFCCMGCVKK